MKAHFLIYIFFFRKIIKNSSDFSLDIYGIKFSFVSYMPRNNLLNIESHSNQRYLTKDIPPIYIVDTNFYCNHIIDVA